MFGSHRFCSTLLRGAGVALLLGALGILGCERIVLDFDSGRASLPSGDGDDGDGGRGGDSAVDLVPEPPPAPEVVLEEDTDLSVDSPSGRNCSRGELASFRVAGLDGRSLALTDAVRHDCLLPGDEVLLIEMQGNSQSVDRVGQHELLRVRSVDGTDLELVADPLLPYGDGPVGAWDASGFRVYVQRVPSFSRLTVGEGATVTASRWDDGGSGVMAMRVLGDLRLDGTISMNGHGYRGGAERTEVLQHGLQGESLGGLGTTLTAPNIGGGGGGLGDQERDGCVQDGNAGGGGGHLMRGQDAVVDDLCGGEGRGRGGLAYAASGKLLLGSGGGSGGVDNVRVDNPPGAPGGNGGGVVWILAQSISGAGRIEARGMDGVGDPEGFECLMEYRQDGCYDHSGPGGGGAGGSVRLTASQVSGITLDVGGGRGGNGYDTAPGNGGDGSVGVIEAPGI